MASSRRSPRVTLSVRVRPEVAARVREFVRDNAGRPLYLSLAGFIEAAAEAHLAALERQLAGDQPHPRPSANSRR